METKSLAKFCCSILLYPEKKNSLANLQKIGSLSFTFYSSKNPYALPRKTESCKLAKYWKYYCSSIFKPFPENNKKSCKFAKLQKSFLYIL